ncbi:hypothetical protein POPTR_014G114801v4 [Populus trichocarpa]|uniref:1-phosphatidylinositol 4-kinase n=1 Tax=Populus trichocarpa TaxID=3694 RepID=A0A2K1XT76_POPTR|nr:hypothetical protein POPTR_014G114801v4 [Populus trichocarpa]
MKTTYALSKAFMILKEALQNLQSFPSEKILSVLVVWNGTL